MPSRRSSRVASLAACKTAGPNRVPGWSRKRSSGPLTAMTAFTVSCKSSIGELTLPTPTSLSASNSAQPRCLMRSSCSCDMPNFLPSAAHGRNAFPPDPRIQGQDAPGGNGHPQAAGWFERRDADPHVSFANVQLHALPGLPAQVNEHRPEHPQDRAWSLQRRGPGQDPQPDPVPSGLVPDD